jgi:hypothetical protein
MQYFNPSLFFFWVTNPGDEEAAEVASKNFDAIIKTVVRENKWAPDIIGALFVDEIDFHGLEYWYNDSVEMDKELKNKNRLPEMP